MDCFSGPLPSGLPLDLAKKGDGRRRVRLKNVFSCSPLCWLLEMCCILLLEFISHTMRLPPSITVTATACGPFRPRGMSGFLLLLASFHCTIHLVFLNLPTSLRIVYELLLSNPNSRHHQLLSGKHSGNYKTALCFTSRNT